MRHPSLAVVQSSGQVLNRGFSLQFPDPVQAVERLAVGQLTDGLIIACSVCSGNYDILIASLKNKLQKKPKQKHHFFFFLIRDMGFFALLIILVEF